MNNMEEKNLIDVLRNIANSIKKHSGLTEEEYEDNKIAPNEFYNKILLFAEHTYAESMVDTTGDGNSIIRKVIFDGSITTIGQNAFQKSNLLTDIVFHNNNKNIGKTAFSMCTSLSNIDWGGITTIDANAFENCTGIKSLNLSANISSIGRRAFFGCSNIESIEIDTDNSAYYSEGNCIMSKDGTVTLVQGCKNSIIPDNTEIIGDSSFGSIYSLITINIPDSVTTIDKYAFQNCNSLEVLTIGSGVKIIEPVAFNAGKFKEMRFPAGLENIGTSALSVANCKKFDFSKCNATTPPICSGTAFGTRTTTDWTIIVPKGGLDVWKSATGWSNYAERMVEATDTND